MIKYRLTFEAGGYMEDRDLEVLKEVRLMSYGTIVQLQSNFTITNDPEMRIFNESDDVDEVLQTLRSDTFQKDSITFATNPQPAGLN